MKRIILLVLFVASLVFSISPLGLAADSSRVTIDTSGHPFVGQAKAPITIVVFSDYL